MRLLISLFIFVSFLIVLPCSAQIPDTLWTRTYGNEFNNSGASFNLTDDGGYIIFGQSYPCHQGYLIKVDSLGNEEWSQTIGGDNLDDAFNSGYQTDGSGYICAGATESYGTVLRDFWLLKTDLNGNIVWSQTYGGVDDELCYSVQPTSDGGNILAGFVNTPSGIGAQWMLVKTDSDGNEEWRQLSGNDETNIAFDVKQTIDGGFIFTGGSIPPEQDYYDFLVTKTDASGNVEWTYTYGSEEMSDRGNSIILTSDGGYLACGYAGEEYIEICLIKLDENGNEEWVRIFGEDGSVDRGLSVCQTDEGGFVLTGCTTSPQSNWSLDAWIIRTDNMGNIIWDSIIGGSDSDYGQCIRINNQNQFIMSGSTCSFGSGELDAWLVCLDAEITPSPFYLITPADAQMLHTSSIDFSWSNSISIRPEYDVSYNLCVNMSIADWDTTTYFTSLSDTSITMSVQEMTGLEEWNQMITGNWYVQAIAGPDTTRCDSDFIFRVSTLQGNSELLYQEIPATFHIQNIYPNPFNSSTTISITLPEKSNLHLSLFNLTGQQVAVLADQQVDSGKYEFVYKANGLSSGVYFIRAFVPGRMNEIKKIVFLQ